MASVRGTLLNDADHAVIDMLEGIVESAPAGMLRLLPGLPDIKVVARADADKGKVALISGAFSKLDVASPIMQLLCMMLRLILGLHACMQAAGAVMSRRMQAM
jgi:hypothetical protein